MTVSEFVLSTPAGDAVRDNYRRQGAAAERERIIKLIEEQGKLVWHTNCVECLNPAPETWIALIKGENK